MLIDVPSSIRHPNGRWVHRFRQSDVTRFRQCPELHRLTLLKELPEFQNDSAALGTAVHAGIEAALRAIKDGETPNFGVSNSIAQASFVQAWESPGFRQVQVATLKLGCSLIYDCIERFWNEVLPTLSKATILGIEHRFDVSIHSDEKREIRICGTRDLDITDSVIDFKTSNGAYSGRDAWKHERYDVQPTMYVWARAVEEGTDKLASFSYCVLPREGKPPVDWLPVERTWQDIDFLFDELWRLALLIEAELPEWTLGPTDWHCSSKWCVNWENCRGKHIGPDPWGLLARNEVELTKKGKK